MPPPPNAGFPIRLSFREWTRLGWRIKDAIIDDQIGLLAAGVGYYFYNKQKRASKTPFTAIVPPPASSPAAAAEQPKADLPVPPKGGAASSSSDQGRPGMTWLASQEAADATSFA